MKGKDEGRENGVMGRKEKGEAIGNVKRVMERSDEVGNREGRDEARKKGEMDNGGA